VENSVYKYAFVVSVIILSGIIANIGIANAQLYPNPAIYPMSVQISNNYQSVPVGSICTTGGCTAPTQANIEACASGGSMPYTVIVYENNQQVDTGATFSCFSYDFTPPSVGTYSILFKFIDSGSPSNSGEATAVVVGAPQTSGSSGGASASLSTTEQTVNVGEATPITLSIPGGSSTPYSVKVYVNGNLMATPSVYSSYTYSLFPAAVGTYIVEFYISDGVSTTTQTATIYAVPGGGNAANPGGSTSSGGGSLSVTVSPSYKSVSPGTPVLISATAEGGSPPYKMILYDGSGTTLTSSTTGTISYTYVGYTPNTSVPLTASVSDSQGQVTGQTVFISTTASTGGTVSGSQSGSGGLSVSANPATQDISAGQSLQVAVTPSGGIAPYYIVVRDSAGDVLAASHIQSSGTPYIFTTTQDFPGTNTYTFQITDGAFNSASAIASVVTSGTGGTVSSSSGSNSGTIVTPSGSAPSLSASASPGSVSVGQQSQFTIMANGGTPPYYLVIWSPSGSVLKADYINTQGGSYTYSVSEQVSGTYSYTFKITDANFNSAYAIASVTATGSTISSGQTQQSSSGSPTLSVTPSTQSVSVGQQAQFTITPSGGTAPYYIVIRGSSGSVLKADYIQSSGAAYTFSATQSVAGTSTYSFQITDSAFNNVAAIATVTGS